MTQAATSAAAPERTYSGARLGLMTFALILAPLVQVFDTSVVSIALTQMQGSLSATQDQIAWVLTSYLIAITIATPLWGRWGDRRGHRKALVRSAVFSSGALALHATAEVDSILALLALWHAELVPLPLDERESPPRAAAL